MAKQAGLGDAFYIGGYNLSGDVSSVDTVSARRATIDTPVLEKSAMVRLPGMADGEISFTSWFDDGTDLSHTALKSLSTTDSEVLYCSRLSGGDASGKTD